MVRKPPNAVEIKGFGNDVNIIFSEDAAFSDVETELIRRLENSGRFFSGVEVILDIGDRVVNAGEWKSWLILSLHFDTARRYVRKKGKRKWPESRLIEKTTLTCSEEHSDPVREYGIAATF